MLLKLLDNRVRRSYNSGGIIDNYTGKMPANYPEDWIGSVVEAFNPGFDKIENEGLSRIGNGDFLKDYISKNEKCLGKQRDVNILVKFLDAGERLVIQCHPTDEFAMKYFNSQYGKTECWYIVEAKKGACVYLGFNKKATREKWIDAFKLQDKELMLSFLHKIEVSAGDVIFVPGGVPHAIGEGCFMVELQQPTDLMVIPERQTLSGRVLDEMKLHGGLGFEKMFDCFNYDTYEFDEILDKCVIKIPQNNNGVISVINSKFTDKFSMDIIGVDGEYRYCNGDSFNVFVITEGEGEFFDGVNKYKAQKGDKFFVEANSDIKIKTKNKILICVCKP